MQRISFSFLSPNSEIISEIPTTKLRFFRTIFAYLAGASSIADLKRTNQISYTLPNRE